MDDLTVLELYGKSDSNKANVFKNNIDSSLQVKTDFNKTNSDFGWLEIMEETVVYLDNILHNPNKFIVNEEEVVKIELARRVTTESIKHLSQHTNFIQDIDEKTGDVRPSKILNVNKEESYNTYENRFIYSLIKNMQMFVDKKKQQKILEPTMKNNKNISYNANAVVGKEKVSVALTLDSKMETKNSKGTNDIAERIERLELRITDLTGTEVFKNLAKLHVALVTSPIKKTNVILKNVNFQYAVKLWNYLQSYVDNDTKEEKEKKDYNETGPIKRYIDETVLLDYLVVDTINKQEQGEKVNKKEVSEKLVANMVQKVLDVNESLSEEQLKNIVSKQYAVVKYKNVVNDMEIQKKFKKHLNEYIKRVSEAKLV